MRLFEIITPPLYLSTSTEHKPGEIVQTRTLPLGSEREGPLEKRRSEGALSRQTSLHLKEEPDPDAAHIYLVQPIGQIDRHHTSWLRKLQEVPITSIGEMDQCAGGYWSDKPIPEDQSAPWEFLAAEAKVLKRVGGTEWVPDR